MHTRRWMAVMGGAALAALPAVVLVGSAGTAGAVPAGDETSFRTAWDTATEITLTADITLTCGTGEAVRTSSDPVVLDGAGHTVRLATGCVARVLRNDGDGATTLRNVTITGGRTNVDGGGYEHNGTGSLTIEHSTISDNVACSEGGGVEVESDVPVTVRSSTIAGNRSADEAGIDLDDGGDLLIVNSTFTANVANSDGAISVEQDDEEGSVTLVSSTVVGNIETEDGCTIPQAVEATAPPATPNGDADATSDDGTVEPAAPPTSVVEAEAPEPEDEGGDVGALDAGEPANVSIGGGVTFRSFGTVIAGPIGNGSPTPNCEIDDGIAAVTSAGYNFSDDATCLLTNVAAGDRENAGSPAVGPLAGNGGPTQTMLPLAGSPLLDWIPLAACGGGNGLAGFAVTDDQRGVSRPQGPGCDVGAVEVELVLSFTG